VTGDLRPTPAATATTGLTTPGRRPGVDLPHDCVPAGPAGPSAAPPPAARRPGSTRLAGIDAARGIALIGMMAIHVLDPVGPDDRPSVTWDLAAGKSAALFALLAGVAVAFTTGRRERPHGRAWTASAAALVVRALLIAVVGLLLGYLVPSSAADVILPYYALLFLLAVPLLSLSIRSLLVCAAVIGVGMPLLSHLLRSGLGAVVPANPTFGDLVTRPGDLLVQLTLTGTYPALSWLSYLCVGLAVGRAALSSRRTVAVMTLSGVALAVGAKLVSWLLLDVVGGRASLEAAALQSMSQEEYFNVLLWGPTGVTPTNSPWWLATMPAHSSTPLDLAFTIGVGLAVLGVCILIGRTTTTALRPLAAAGSMTLTLYALHLLMLSSPLMPDGDGASFLLQVAVVLTFGLLWTRYHARGPLEDLVTAATTATRRRVLRGRAGRTDHARYAA
jgi:uncharacterized membrane protein YeiB